MIIGHGIDLVDVRRIAHLVERFGDKFLTRIFTEQERQYCQQSSNPAESLAVRFAAKEALYKVISPEKNFLNWQEIEVKINSQQKPGIKLAGRTREAAKKMGITHFHLSLSHEREQAVASLIAEQRRESQECYY